MNPLLATEGTCTGCLACVDTCAKSALHKILGEDGHIYVDVDECKCVGCKLCEKTCPVVSELTYGTSPLATAFAGWAKNDVVRRNAATAGAFSALALYTLSLGGYVCGAAIVDGIYVKHICINNAIELPRLQGSKYTQSDASGIYKTVYDKLKDGSIVLFSGTGCQVAGLYGYVGKKKYTGKLITIDLICGGVPSRLLIQKFVENEPFQTREIISFRSKDNGWKPNGFKYNLKVVDTDGVLHDYTGKRNLITTGFACEMTDRYSCYDCKFAGLHRMSDFTIGDYWGIKDYPEQHFHGVSAIIVHNEEALELLKSANAYIEVKEVDINDINNHSRRLVAHPDKRYKLPERKYMAKIFNKFSYSTLKHIYAYDFGEFSPWMLYKVYRTLASKFINR